MLVCWSAIHFETSVEGHFFAAAESEENTQSQIVNEAERNAVSLELSCNYVTHGSQHEKAKRDCWQFVPSPLRALVELSEAKRD